MTLPSKIPLRSSRAVMTNPNVLVALGLTAGYAALGAAVMAKKTTRLDRALRRLQRHPATGPRRAVATGVKRIALPECQLIAAAAIAIAMRRARVPGGGAVMGAAVAVFLADRASKRFTDRRRPPGYHGNKSYESFPSGHTAATTALTLTVARVLEREGLAEPWIARLVAAALIGIVGESRLVLDEHWPTDVLAGGLLGAAVSDFALAADGLQNVFAGRARSR